MKVSDLNKMESIVSSNPYLTWDGWNVVFLEKDEQASLKKNAAFLIRFQDSQSAWKYPYQR
jgi:hypothetical protein